MKATCIFQKQTIIVCNISDIAKPSKLMNISGDIIISTENIICVNHSLYNSVVLFKKDNVNIANGYKKKYNQAGKSCKKPSSKLKYPTKNKHTPTVENSI